MIVNGVLKRCWLSFEHDEKQNDRICELCILQQLELLFSVQCVGKWEERLIK